MNSGEELFNNQRPLSFRTGYDEWITVAENYSGQTGTLITIYEADLSIDEARMLRDWLNKVLP